MWFVLELGTVIEVIGVTLCLAGGAPIFIPGSHSVTPPGVGRGCLGGKGDCRGM